MNKNWKIAIGIVALFWVIMLANAYADTPTLHRRTDPPVPTLSCSDEMHRLRKGMVEVSIQEALLWEAHHERKMSDFFLVRSHTAKYTRDLNVSYENCTPGNIKELNIILANWEYMYADDM